MQGGSDNTAFAFWSRGRGVRNAAGAGRRWRLMLRPCAPGLFALALAVFLWGLGAKLSLYHHHSKPVARTAVAKLWTGPRTVFQAPGAPRRRPAHAPGSRQMLPAPVQVCAALGSFTATAPTDLLNPATFQRSRLPARAPPPQEIL